jgi:hypothetical protein
LAKRKKTQATRPETSTQKKLRQKNYEEGEKGKEANTEKTSDAKTTEESQGEVGTGESQLDGGGGLEKVGCQTARVAARCSRYSG